jgi:hypothetical protein
VVTVSSASVLVSIRPPRATRLAREAEVLPEDELEEALDARRMTEGGIL